MIVVTKDTILLFDKTLKKTKELGKETLGGRIAALNERYAYIVDQHQGVQLISLTNLSLEKFWILPFIQPDPSLMFRDKAAFFNENAIFKTNQHYHQIAIEDKIIGSK